MNGILEMMQSAGRYDEIKQFFQDNPDLVQDAFVSLLNDGDISNAEYFLRMDNDLLYLFDNLYFDMCHNDNLDAAKWLFLKKPDIHKAIMIACEFGYLELVKWIYSMNNLVLNDCYTNGMLLIGSCGNGHIEVAKWLMIEMNLLMHPSNLDVAFRMSCINGHVVVAQWLVSVRPLINITSKDNYAFKGACERGCLNVAQWLFGIIPDIPIDVVAYSIKAACENGHLCVAQWIVSVCPDVCSYSHANSRAIEYAFRVACECGCLEIAQWLLEMHPDIAISSCDNYAFENACYNGHLNVVVWMLGLSGLHLQICDHTFMKVCAYGHRAIAQIIVNNRFEITRSGSENTNVCLSIVEDAFPEVCRYGKIEMIQWLFAMYPELDLSANNEFAFKIACSNGKLEVAKWLLSTKPTINILVKKTTNFGIVGLFQMACMDGYLEIAQWFFSINSFQISEDDEFAFRYACKMGHLDVAKWLIFVKPDINIGIKDNWAFKNALKNGHMPVAKWLFSLNPLMIQSIKNNIFEKVCNNGYLLIAKWLYAKCNFDTISPHTFQNVCASGDLELAKWLYSNQPEINISADNDQSLRGACHRGNIHVAQWLLSIHPNVNPLVIDAAFLRACEFNAMRTAVWLSSIDPKYVIEMDENIINYFIKRTLPIIKNQKKKSKDDIDNHICPICMECPVSIQTNCVHNYCEMCLTKHYYHNTKCPLCRTEIIECYELEVDE